MMNWLSSDEDLISIRPKEPEDRRLSLSRRQMGTIFSSSVVGLPLIVIAAGFDGLVETTLMKFKGLLIAVIVLAGLGGGVYCRTRPSRRKRKRRQGCAAKILTIPDDQFKSIRLQKTGGDYHGSAEVGCGQMGDQGAQALAADQDSVGSVVSALASLTSDRLIETRPPTSRRMGWLLLPSK